MTAVETQQPGEGDNEGLGENQAAIQALAADTSDGAMPVAVSVAERGSLLPPSAELELPTTAKTLDEIRADIDEEQRQAERLDPIKQPLLADRERSRAAEFIEASNKAVAEGLIQATAGARSKEDFNQKAAEYLHTISDQNALADGLRILNDTKNSSNYDENEAARYLKTIAEYRKRLGRDIVTISENGILTLNSDDPQFGALAIALETAESEFNKRGKVNKARDALRSSWKNNQVRRKNEKYVDEAYKFNDEVDEWLAAVRDAEEEKMWDEAIAENASHDARKAREAQEAINNALLGPVSFEGFVGQEVTKALDPIRAELRQVLDNQHRLRTVTASMNILDHKDLEAKLALEKDEIIARIKKVKHETIEKMKADRAQLTLDLHKQAQEIIAFEGDYTLNNHVYKPDEEMHPELVALVAGANARLVGANREPLSIDEYTIKHEKGHPTLMQRLVYKTKTPDVFIVEDWDKTSGKLKRQALMRGNDVIVPEKGRFGRKTGKLTVSNEAYAELGVIQSSDVVSDVGTPADTGYADYVRNLTRSGGVSLDTAKMLADTNPKRKLGASKGFIAMLQEEWAKNKTAATKKK